MPDWTLGKYIGKEKSSILPKHSRQLNIAVILLL